MLELYGPLEAARPSRVLLLVPALPAAAAVLAALLDARAARPSAQREHERDRDRERERDRGRARAVVVAALGAALAVAAALGVRAAPGGGVVDRGGAVDDGGAFVARAWRFFHVGRFDVACDFHLDVAAAVACVVVAVAGIAAVVASARAVPPGAPTATSCTAPIAVACAGAIVAVLGDDVVTTSIGGAAVALALARLVALASASASAMGAPTSSTRLLGLLLACDAAVVFGVALVAWGLAGGPSSRPASRFGAGDTIWAQDAALVHVGATAAAAGDRALAAASGRSVVFDGAVADGGPAHLAVTAWPGAAVAVDGVPLVDGDGAVVFSPCARAAVPPGAHVVGVVVAGAADVVHAVRAWIAPADDLALVPLGPTLSLHAVRDELTLGVAGAGESLRDAFAARRCAGLPLAALAAFAIVFGVVARAVAGLFGALGARARRRDEAIGVAGAPAAAVVAGAPAAAVVAVRAPVVAVVAVVPIVTAVVLAVHAAAVVAVAPPGVAVVAAIAAVVVVLAVFRAPAPWARWLDASTSAIARADRAAAAALARVVPGALDRVSRVARAVDRVVAPARPPAFAAALAPTAPPAALPPPHAGSSAAPRDSAVVLVLVGVAVVAAAVVLGALAAVTLVPR